MHLLPSRITMLLSVAVLAACTTQAPEPQTETLLPAQWELPAGTGDDAIPVADAWWTRFQSRELNQLIDQTMQGNFDLLASFQRIEQARARLSSSRASLFPQLDASYSASSNTRWDENDERTNGESDTFGLSASYEVDLWGQVRAGNEAALAALAGSTYSHHTVALGLQAQVASSYFQYLAGKDRLRFAEESLSNSRKLLALVEAQFREGSASRLQLVQQQTSIISQEAQINSLRHSLQQVVYALDVLLGQTPGTLQLSGQSLSDIRLPDIAPGQPTELLQRRPDILQAEAALASAHANVDAARAAFYPSLRITGGATASQLLIGNPATQVASLAASLAAPLIDGGRNRAEYRRTQAAQEEALLHYYQTLLTAVGEVQTSLLNIGQTDSNLQLQAQRLTLSKESFALAELLYKAGSADFITLLDAERSLLTAQDLYVQSELDQYVEAVNLYRALGGSWYSQY